MSWQGISWTRGTPGDQLKRSAGCAVFRYTEGFYADAGNKAFTKISTARHAPPARRG
jgi:hypothetical protein